MVGKTTNNWAFIESEVSRLGLIKTQPIPAPKDPNNEVDKKYNLREFKEADPSTSKIEPISLQAIDLSKYIEGAEGLQSRKDLAAELEKSISTYGFFNLINIGYPLEELNKLRSIAQSLLELPNEEKLKYLAGATERTLENKKVSLGGERGAGFKPKGYWTMQNKVRDSIEHYNFRDMCQDNYFFDKNRKYPEIAKAHLPEVAAYFRYLHFNVLRKLLNLCDLILELPEGYLWENYFKVYKDDLYNSGSGFGRFMHYLGMSSEEEKKTNNNWLRGHSDGTAFTFITSQPILSLQIRDYYTGEWRYVGHRKNSLIVNIGDSMEFLTGGYFKSSIHRVVAPPEDQRKFRRLVLIYFCNCALSTIIDPEEINSPKLNRLGYKKPASWEKITSSRWDEEKGRLFGDKDSNDVSGDEPKAVLLFGRLHERWHQNDNGKPPHIIEQEATRA
ncbi:hypothetical protein PACTADRAFT_87042 [Pachysolen tannophilus NRRL Y-2460]|uniref:Fe2OG dioxygenase domain-containing protein n=1 Tax=Pachysolen tannophilus NRRL Y-2460 TaxID=669874 RepID=A0A1E4TMY9_PACTA|nr:hypothetical protein PACTADRAFT_87042 [Pachysolen tannophilus NRRL Y-2460]